MGRTGLTGKRETQAKKLFKNKKCIFHFAVGENTNRGDPPWPVAHRPALELYEIPALFLSSF